MQIYRKTHILFFICSLLISFQAIGQTGTIKGKIIDSEDVLVGATISLQNNKSKGANSDLSGEFTIIGVPIGTQNLVASYLGYETKIIEVDVKEGGLTEILIEMTAGVVEGAEVVITGQKRGQTQAINQQLASDNIANIVSSDRIQELPDVNAAEAIGRLPGVALTRSGGEGQKVVIRGMAPKFSAITVNGVRLPSNSATDRSVDLSLISPELLDAIEVFKSPLPDMDAEATGGTVNLRIRKAPEKFHVLAKGLYGYNAQANEFKDYKGVLQMSNRFLKNKLGVIAQGSLERFNRSADFLSNSWRSGPLDSTTNLVPIIGTGLTFQDRQEIRKRYNGSLSVDYDLSARHSLTLFGLFSQTNNDFFSISEAYSPVNNSLNYTGIGQEGEKILYQGTLSGDHNLDFMKIDWSLSSSESIGRTPYNYEIRFNDSENTFTDTEIGNQAFTFYDAANPSVPGTNLVGGEHISTDNAENSVTALVNFTVPFKLGKKITADLKFGGKYYQIDRERDYDILSENFYYLGGIFTANAVAEYEREGGALTYLPTNSSLIGMPSFFSSGPAPEFVTETGENVTLRANLDPNLVRAWYESQKDILSNNRNSIVNRYMVNESITAGYAMIRFKVGDKLTVIPGFRYELSDNEYKAGVSTVNGRYGVNGTYTDTTTFQNYDEFLPHLHIKFQPMDWFDIRASYAQTLARPDFAWITPRTRINQTQASMVSGNPELEHSKTTQYDVQLSAYKGTLGLITIGGFYKDVKNLFFPWVINLTDEETALQYGWPDYKGYELSTYDNLPESNNYGFEVDVQSYLSFLPKPFNNFVLNANYSRLYSNTKAFFTLAETRLVIVRPPTFETTYTTETRDVEMLSMSPHIVHLSLGYDVNKFSARISAIFQGTKASGYSRIPSRDNFTQKFWRLDAAIKQGIGENWNIFLNLNNLTNQQDINFTRNDTYLTRIQTYGFTGTMGLQFKM